MANTGSRFHLPDAAGSRLNGGGGEGPAPGAVGRGKSGGAVPGGRAAGRSRRQRVRNGVLLFSFLLFPVTQNYLSPYVIIDGAFQGIIAGSTLMFTAMFLSSLFLGRSFCSWVCPGGAFSELCFHANDRRVNGKRLDPVKYFIWIPWLGVIILAFVLSGGIVGVNPLHLTETGISVDEPAKYFMYYFVAALFFIPSLLVGRRATCHTVCWMAPFMVVGRKLGNAFRIPSLRLRSEPGRCTSCGTCSKNCPMSLDVKGMVASGSMEKSECILCGRCVDSCPGGAVAYSFRAFRKTTFGRAAAKVEQ